MRMRGEVGVVVVDEVGAGEEGGEGGEGEVVTWVAVGEGEAEAGDAEGGVEVEEEVVEVGLPFLQRRAEVLQSFRGIRSPSIKERIRLNKSYCKRLCSVFGEKRTTYYFLWS